MVPDHLGRLTTFPALMAAAGATRHIKLATYVLNQDAVNAAAYDRTGSVPEKPAGQLTTVDELRRRREFVRYRLGGDGRGRSARADQRRAWALLPEDHAKLRARLQRCLLIRA